jgi:glutathione S-transferase
MLTIYGSYRSRATRIIWLCDELGVPFDLKPVLQARRIADPNAPDLPPVTQSEAVLRRNPNGRVPFIDDDGFAMFESLAITLYLAKKHGGPLSPADLQEDAMMTMWTVWSVTELEPISVQIAYHHVLLPPDERDEAVAQAAAEALAKPFRVLDDWLEGRRFIVGDRFTVADINVAECARYAQTIPELFHNAPNLKNWLERCQARPVYQAMMQKREAETNLV